MNIFIRYSIRNLMKPRETQGKFFIRTEVESIKMKILNRLRLYSRTFLFVRRSTAKFVSYFRFIQFESTILVD